MADVALVLLEPGVEGVEVDDQVAADRGRAAGSPAPRGRRSVAERSPSVGAQGNARSGRARGSPSRGAPIASTPCLRVRLVPARDAPRRRPPPGPRSRAPPAGAPTTSARACCRSPSATERRPDPLVDRLVAQRRSSPISSSRKWMLMLITDRPSSPAATRLPRPRVLRGSERPTTEGVAGGSSRFIGRAAGSRSRGARLDVFNEFVGTVRAHAGRRAHRGHGRRPAAVPRRGPRRLLHRPRQRRAVLGPPVDEERARIADAVLIVENLASCPPSRAASPSR